MVDDDDDDDGRRTTDDGRTPDHGHPISSPCEPNGSGELKTIFKVKLFYFIMYNKCLMGTLTNEQNK